MGCVGMDGVTDLDGLRSSMPRNLVETSETNRVLLVDTAKCKVRRRSFRWIDKLF